MRNSDHLLLITKQHPGQYFVSLPYSPVATEKQDLLDVTYFCSKVHHRRQASDSRKLALSRLSPIYPCLRKESEININLSPPQEKGTNHYSSGMERAGERFTPRSLRQVCLQSLLRETLALASKLWVLVAQSCLTLCNPMDWSPPGSSVHGILQARILEWVAIPFSRGSSWSRDWTQVSCIAGRFFTI